MSRLYICAHNSKVETRAIIDVLVAENAIEDWFFSMRGTFFCRSSLQPQALSNLFVAKFGNGRHFFADITESAKWGALPTKQWEKILQKKISG